MTLNDTDVVIFAFVVFTNLKGKVMRKNLWLVCLIGLIPALLFSQKFDMEKYFKQDFYSVEYLKSKYKKDLHAVPDTTNGGKTIQYNVFPDPKNLKVFGCKVRMLAFRSDNSDSVNSFSMTLSKKKGWIDTFNDMIVKNNFTMTESNQEESNANKIRTVFKKGNIVIVVIAFTDAINEVMILLFNKNPS